MDLEFKLNLPQNKTPRQSHLAVFESPSKDRRTSQFVAVKGRRDHSHPDCACLSDVKRIYLQQQINITTHRPYPQSKNMFRLTYWSARMIVSPPQSNHRLWSSESRYGCYPASIFLNLSFSFSIRGETNLVQAVCAQGNGLDVFVV